MRKFINAQRKMSRYFDRLLPEEFLVDGNKDFATSLVPKYTREGIRIYDVGGGKNPFYEPHMELKKNLKISGLDIDKNELDRAPEGSYDEMIHTDLLTYRGEGDADLVICQTLLKHVKDQEKGVAALASI